MNDNAAQHLAQACARQMYNSDLASQGMGIELVEVNPGRAVMSMTVKEHMLNGQGLCHGGFIFSLADSAFAFACNTYNNKVVGAGCRIEYVLPGELGDRLTATAIECFNRGQSGLYDVVVSNQHRQEIAFFRGNSRRVKGQLLDDDVINKINSEFNRG